MAINKTTQEMRNKIRRNTVITMPDRPSERGIRASDIKDALSKPICGDENSVLAELDRVVDAINEELTGVAEDIADINLNTDSKVPTTRKVNGHSLDDDIVLKPEDLGLTAAYQYRGSVATYADLPLSGMVAGDVYNVVAANGNYPADTNYAWNGTAWDPLGGAFNTGDLQPRTVFSADSSTTAIVHTVANNECKAYNATGIASVQIVIPVTVDIGFSSGVTIKYGDPAPAVTFVNNSTKSLRLVQYGETTPSYTPFKNTTCRMLIDCDESATVTVWIIEVA